MAGETMLTIIGNLARDPELRTLGNGSTYGDPNRGPAQNGWQNRQPQSPAPAQSQAPASPVEPGVQQGDPWAQTMPATPGSGFGASTDFPSNDSDPEF